MTDLKRLRTVKETLARYELSSLPHLLPGCEERLAAYDEKSMDRIAKSLRIITLEQRSPPILVQAVQAILRYEGAVACEVAEALSCFSSRRYPTTTIDQATKIFGHDVIVACLGRHPEPTSCEIVRGAGRIALDTRLEANSIKALVQAIQTVSTYKERAAREIIRRLGLIALFKRSADTIITACKEIKGKPPDDALKILAGFLK